MNHPASANFDLIACEICGQDRFAILCDWNHLSQVMQCVNCGLQFVNPMPNREYLNQLYQQDGEDHAYYTNYIQERKDRWPSYRKQYNRRLDLIEKYCGKKGRLLDIGCGGGFFMQAALERGWEPHGIDIVPGFISFARDELRLRHVHSTAFEETPFPERHFDVVVLWDLIEHLRRPRAYLEKINRVLRPGGLLIIWTPNAANAAWLKEKWFGYTPLQHLYFFSTPTLKAILQATGFRMAYKNTNRAKKGFFFHPSNAPYRKPNPAQGGLKKLLMGIKRDLKNFVNPVNYISPLLDWAGYGFNLYVIGQKCSDLTPRDGRDAHASAIASSPSGQ